MLLTWALSMSHGKYFASPQNGQWLRIGRDINWKDVEPGSQVCYDNGKYQHFMIYEGVRYDAGHRVMSRL